MTETETIEEGSWTIADCGTCLDLNVEICVACGNCSECCECESNDDD